VLDAPEDARFAIYEMGAGKPGDIAYLTAIARPDVALVNNIAPAHLERMGSLLGVADTKGAIYDALPADGVAVINADDAFAPYFAERAHGRRLIRFGLEASADVTARASSLDADGARFVLVTPRRGRRRSAMPGRHNVLNALAAASIALGAGIAGGDRRGPGGARRSPVAWSRIACQRRHPDRRQLQRQSRFAQRGDRHARHRAATPRGWCSATCANSARTPNCCTPKPAVARRARASRAVRARPLSAHAVEAFGRRRTISTRTRRLRAALRKRPAQGVRVLVKGSRGSAMDKIVSALLRDEGNDPHAA
jgi:UDP-N-acetylmuramoyl-tripeptide--D-alanyl-D-alanine ligase